MIQAYLPPQDIIPMDLFDPIPIEYRMSITCGYDENLENGRDTFTYLIDNAITSQNVALKNRISEIDNLQDNWDGYGAIVPSKTVIKNAFKFIDCILLEGFNFIKKDDIVPTPYGSIVFDFNTKKGLVSVEVGTNEIGFFTEFVDQNDFASDGINTDFRTIPEDLAKAFNYLYEEQRRISA